ncbi:MATE family efflux transporter [Methanobrevibacter sp.]
MPKMDEWIDETIKEPLVNSAKQIYDQLNGKTEDLKTLVQDNPKKALSLMSIPSFLSLFCLSLNGLVDIIFVSECGEASLIGVGIIQSIFTIMVGFGSGVAVATNSSLSYAISKYVSNKNVCKIVDNSVVLTLIIGIILSILLILILKPLLIALHIPNIAINEALTYGYVLFAGNVFFFFSTVIPAILKAEGEIIKTTYAFASTSILNIILDYILIKVLGYGVLGAAIATVICSVICGCVLLYFITKSKNIHFSFKSASSDLDFQIMKKIIKDALPVSFESIVLSLFGFLANMIFNLLDSSINWAGFIASYRVYTFAIMPIIAIAEANVTITAYLYGQKNFESIKNLLKYELKIGCLISIVLWIIIFLSKNFITGLFVTDGNMMEREAIEYALPILNVLLIIMPLGLISVSILQGLQEYKKSFILSTLRSVILEILFGFIGVLIFENVFMIYLGIITGGLLGCLISLYMSRKVINTKIKEVANVN